MVRSKFYIQLTFDGETKSNRPFACIRDVDMVDLQHAVRGVIYLWLREKGYALTDIGSSLRAECEGAGNDLDSLLSDIPALDRF